MKSAGEPTGREGSAACWLLPILSRRHPIPGLKRLVEMAIRPTEVTGYLCGRLTSLEHAAGLLQLARADVGADGLAGICTENQLGIRVGYRKILGQRSNAYILPVNYPRIDVVAHTLGERFANLPRNRRLYT